MTIKQKPICIQSEEIAAMAQQGVERALAAREHMVELSSKEVDDVSGGLGFYFPIIAGGFTPIDSFSFTPVVESPDINSSLISSVNVSSLMNIGQQIL